MSDAPPISRSTAHANLADALRALATARAALSAALLGTDFAHADEAFLSCESTERAARTRVFDAYTAVIEATPADIAPREHLTKESQVIQFVDAETVKATARAHVALSCASEEDWQGLDKYARQALSR